MRRGPNPIVFFILILPFGSSFGYVSVALSYIATHDRGISVSDATKVTAAAFAVHGVKFLWAPLVDATLSKKAWYLIALALTALGTILSSALPISADNLGLLEAVVVASQLGLTLLGMACENFLGNVPEEAKGRASGWYQAGSFVGLGLGGDLALELSQKFTAGWMVGAVMAALMLPCAVALLGVPEPPRSDHGLLQAMRGLGIDIRRLVFSLAGITGLLIALSPVGAGAASNFFAPIADHWHASATLVARVTGSIGGVVSGAGSLLGGWLSDKVNRRLSYAAAGLLTAVAGAVMASSPRTSGAYAGLTLAYSFFNGVAFAAFSAFVLETIGGGAVATKYNVFASLANLAVTYMTRIDGVAYERFGDSGMLYTDALSTVAGIAFLLVMVAVVRQVTGPRPRAVAG